jgi:hypothetical protein
MRLKLRRSDTELVIYREKYGAIAYVAALGVACLVVAVGAYFLSNRAGTAGPFLIAFSLLFGLAGAAVLLRLPAESQKFGDEGGAHVLSADSLGICVSANLGARRQSVLWTTIEEVVLAEKLKMLERCETTLVGRAVIVFLLKDEYESWSPLDRINAGASLSGSGRPYLHVPFPKHHQAPLLEGLRRYAPSRLDVRAEELVVFDYRSGTDSYSSA